MEEIFSKVYELMKQSFPEEEYRNYNQQKNLINNPYYKLITKINPSGELVGFIASWQMDDFSFIEHFAVNPNMRGKGIGSEMLQNFIENSPKPILLEVELPRDNITQKRISFYTRHGFSVNKFKYFQMPLRENSSPIEMHIMSFPTILEEKEFEKMKSIIYKKIYDIN